MQDRIKLNNGKSSKLMCPSEYASLTWEQFRAKLLDGTAFVDITANNTASEGVFQIGTALNKANLVDDVAAEGFGFSTAGEGPTVNDMFKRIGAEYITGTLTAGQTTLTLTDERFKATSMIDIYCETLADGTAISPKKKSITAGSLTLTFFEPYAINIGVKVRVF